MVECDLCVVSATKVSLTWMSATGVKNAEGDSKVLVACHLLVEVNAINGSSSESTTSFAATKVNTCRRKCLSP